ncbi:MAG: LysE family translocator, partial [Pseudomonadota bacterium]
MEISHLIAFNVTLLAAMASPGPAMLYALRSGLSGGRGRAVATAAGLGVMAAAWTALALLGLGTVFALFPVVYGALKLLGGAYLVWLAWMMWRDARLPVAQADATPLGRAFWGGVLVNAANPKSVLFAASVLIVIFPEDLTLGQKAAIVANHFVVELAAYSAFAAALASPAGRAAYLRCKP